MTEGFVWAGVVNDLHAVKDQDCQIPRRLLLWRCARLCVACLRVNWPSEMRRKCEHKRRDEELGCSHGFSLPEMNSEVIDHTLAALRIRRFLNGVIGFAAKCGRRRRVADRWGEPEGRRVRQVGRRIQNGDLVRVRKESTVTELERPVPKLV